MKTKYSSHNRERGSALLIAVVISGLLIVLLASYLDLLSADNKSTVRSQQWNLSMPVVEAGIEEALAHINQNATTNLLVPQNLAPTLLTDGWQSENGAAVMRRSLTTGRYVVSIIVGTNGRTMTIDSVGYFPNLAAATTPGFIAAAGVGTQNSELSRAVRVTTTNIPIFIKALLVKKTLTSNGNAAFADAFDSSDPRYSTNGQYIASKATDGGGIATLSGAANAINFGSATVYGPVATGPGGSISTNSWTIGSHAWQAANPGKHVQPGWLTSDLNVNLPPVQAPTGGGAPAGGTVGGVVYDYILSSGNYQIGTGAFKGKVLVTGNATLYVTSGAAVNFSSSDSIVIQPGASLNLYVGSASATLPNVVNTTTADKFTYFGLPTNTKLVQNVNANFIGNIYAPNADYTLGGNGTGSEQKILGAAVINSMNYNDTFTFHYDAVLGSLGLSRGVVVSTWDEISPTVALAK